MQNVSIHKRHLPEAVKSAARTALGRSIAADEEISVVAVPPQHLRSREPGRVARNLEAFLNRRAAKVKDVPEEEIDAVVDEAVDHVRHSNT